MASITTNAHLKPQYVISNRNKTCIQLIRLIEKVCYGANGVNNSYIMCIVDMLCTSK